MTGRIIVGVDGSAAAERALAWAGVAACASEAELLVAHVADLSLIASPSREERLHDSHLLLADALATAFELGVDQASSVLLTGDPAERLLELSRDAFTIVVGSQGAGRIPSILLGSVAFRLAGRAGCPVALVGEHARMPNDPTASAVVVGEHDPDSDARALTFATTLAQTFDKRVVVAASRDALLVAAQTADVVVLGADRNNVHRMSPTHAIASSVLQLNRCAVVIVGPPAMSGQADTAARATSPLPQADHA